MPHKVRTYFVVGLGRFGLSLCEQLVSLGQRVVAVDERPEKVAVVADLVDYAAEMDATDEEALVKVGAKEADVAIVAIGENIEASILATALLKGLNVGQVVSRAQTALHARVLARVGAHRVIFPERDMGIRLADQFIHPWLTNFSQIPGNEYVVGELAPLPEMTNKSLKEMNFREKYGATLLLLEREGMKIFPGPTEAIQQDDRLLVVGDRKKLESWVERVQDSPSEGEV